MPKGRKKRYPERVFINFAATPEERDALHRLAHERYMTVTDLIKTTLLGKPPVIDRRKKEEIHDAPDASPAA